MGLPDIITIVVIVLIIGLAVLYIVKAKMSGQKCIGCPHSKTCSSKNNQSTNCSSKGEESKCCCNKE